MERVYEADVYPATFDFDAWRQHRDRQRYVEHFITIFRSAFFRDLSGPLLTLTLFAALAGTYETVIEAGNVPWLPSFANNSETAFQLTNLALSLLLVFRTNSSYSRWLDARALWGMITGSTRAFVRQAMSGLPEHATYSRGAAVRWSVAFAYACKAHLREDGDLAKELKGVLDQEEMSLLVASCHRPVTVLQVLSELLAQSHAKGQIGNQDRARLELELSNMNQSLTSCEKILKNPIPLSYTRHTARFLLLWLCWLPFALWTKVHWGVVPVEAVMAYMLLGIDEIAIQLEEPFGILPLESLCEGLQKSLVLMAASHGQICTIVSEYHNTDDHLNAGNNAGTDGTRTSASAEQASAATASAPAAKAPPPSPASAAVKEAADAARSSPTAGLVINGKRLSALVESRIGDRATSTTALSPSNGSATGRSASGNDAAAAAQAAAAPNAAGGSHAATSTSAANMPTAPLSAAVVASGPSSSLPAPSPRLLKVKRRRRKRPPPGSAVPMPKDGGASGPWPSVESVGDTGSSSDDEGSTPGSSDTSGSGSGRSPTQSQDQDLPGGSGTVPAAVAVDDRAAEHVVAVGAIHAQQQ